MNLSKKILIIIINIFTVLFLSSCYDMHPIEDLSIATGFGYDIEKNNEIKLVDPGEFLAIKGKGESGSVILVGKGPTINSLVENRRTKQSKTFIFGTEIVFIISEERAKFGIKDIIEDLLRFPEININANIAVCKGKCIDYFSLKPQTGIISEQLFGMLKFSYEGTFYSKQNSVNDFLLMYYQQGREIYLPYIEISDGKPRLTGAAIFNKDKMIKKISRKETELINLLRNSRGRGYISILSDDPLKYIDVEGKTKGKVKVSTEDDHLKYDIFVNISGDLRIDTLYGEELNKEQISKIEKQFEDKLQKDLDDEVKKVQKEYGVDCLDLGKYALAKYGRDSGYDSNEYFSNANIKVHVNVKIKSIGRIYRSHIED